MYQEGELSLLLINFGIIGRCELVQYQLKLIDVREINQNSLICILTVKNNFGHK